MYLETNYKVNKILKVVLDRLTTDYYPIIETKYICKNRLVYFIYWILVIKMNTI
jgi:hypothetical protein